MTVVIGGFCLAAGVLILQWAYIEHRRPVLAAWLRPEFSSQMICFLSLVLMAIGASIMAGHHLARDAAGLDAIDIGLLVAIAGVSVIAIAAMQRYWHRRRRDWASAAAEVHEFPGGDAGPRPAPNAGRRRRAA